MISTRCTSYEHVTQVRCCLYLAFVEDTMENKVGNAFFSDWNSKVEQHRSKTATATMVCSSSNGDAVGKLYVQQYTNWSSDVPVLSNNEPGGMCRFIFLSCRCGMIVRLVAGWCVLIYSMVLVDNNISWWQGSASLALPLMKKVIIKKKYCNQLIVGNCCFLFFCHFSNLLFVSDSRVSPATSLMSSAWSTFGPGPMNDKTSTDE